MVAGLLLLQLFGGGVGEYPKKPTVVKALQNYVQKQKDNGKAEDALLQYYDCGMCQGVLEKMCQPAPGSDTTLDLCAATNPFQDMAFGRQPGPVRININGPLIDCGGCSCCNNDDCVGDGISVPSPSLALSPVSIGSSTTSQSSTVRCGSCQSVPNTSDSLQQCVNGTCAGTFHYLPQRNVSDPDCPLHRLRRLPVCPPTIL